MQVLDGRCQTQERVKNQRTHVSSGGYRCFWSDVLQNIFQSSEIGVEGMAKLGGELLRPFVGVNLYWNLEIYLYYF